MNEFHDHEDLNLDGSRFAELSDLDECTEVSYVDDDGDKVAGISACVHTDSEGYVTGALIDGTVTNSIIVSATGAGKTRRVLCPYVLSCVYAKESFVVHDPKGEIYGFMRDILVKKGFEIKILNFREPMKGHRFNVLQEAAELYQKGKTGRGLEIANGVAETIFFPIEDSSDRFWTQSACNLFCCYFGVACSLYEAKDVSLSTIYRLHIEGSERSGSVMKIISYLEMNKNEPFYPLGMSTFNEPDKTRESIFCVFSNGLSRVILNDEIQDMTRRSSFNVRDMVKKPMAIFVITRDEEPKTYSTLVSSIIYSVYTTLIDLCTTKYWQRLPKNVHFILEEFGNMSPLEGVNNILTGARSRGIKVVMVVQSLCQLKQIYKPQLAKVLIGNSQNLIYMYSTDIELVELISERCGNTTNQYTNKPRRLMSTDRLAHLKKDKALMLLGRNYAYVATLPDLSKYKMIVPTENVRIPTRKRLKIEYGLLSKKLEEIQDKKINALINEAKKDNDHNEEKNKGTDHELSREEMLKIPTHIQQLMREVLEVLE